MVTLTKLNWKVLLYLYALFIFYLFKKWTWKYLLISKFLSLPKHDMMSVYITTLSPQKGNCEYQIFFETLISICKKTGWILCMLAWMNMPLSLSRLGQSLPFSRFFRYSSFNLFLSRCMPLFLLCVNWWAISDTADFFNRCLENSCTLLGDNLTIWFAVYKSFSTQGIRDDLKMLDIEKDQGAHFDSVMWVLPCTIIIQNNNINNLQRV